MGRYRQATVSMELADVNRAGKRRQTVTQQSNSAFGHMWEVNLLKDIAGNHSLRFIHDCEIQMLGLTPTRSTKPGAYWI